MPNIRLGPAYRIQTSRLVIRCWNPQDAHHLQAAIDASLEHLLPWMPWAKQEPEALQVKVERLRRYRGHFDLGQDFVYGIFNLEETKVLGGSGLHTRVGPNAREIGYWIHKNYINRGLATEVAAALTKVAFVIDEVERVEIVCDPANLASAAVPRKLGYKHEATLRKRSTATDGERTDDMLWTLLAGEYPSSPAAAAEIQAFNVVGGRIL